MSRIPRSRLASESSGLLMWKFITQQVADAQEPLQGAEDMN